MKIVGIHFCAIASNI